MAAHGEVGDNRAQCAHCGAPAPVSDGAWRDLQAGESGLTMYVRDDGWRRVGDRYFCPEPRSRGESDHLIAFGFGAYTRRAIEDAGGTITFERADPDQPSPT